MITDDYLRWNTALIDWSLSHATDDRRVFLSVDEEMLQAVSRRFDSVPEDSAVSFVSAVRSAIGRELSLRDLVTTDADGQPLWAGFLGTMVLAAYHMASDEDEFIDESNYFHRLRELLRLPGVGRPKTLTQRDVKGRFIDASLWSRWSSWLIRAGYLPTARPGHGPWENIAYPISQALLRRGDQLNLAHRIHDSVRAHRLAPEADRATFSAWIYDRANRPSRFHIRRMFDEGDADRIDAFVDKAYEVFLRTDWTTLPASAISEDRLGHQHQRRLSASLLCEMDADLENATFWIYPRLPRDHGDHDELHAVIGDQEMPLRMERRGWACPLAPASLGRGVTLPLRGHATLESVVLPERRFWVLVSDPDAPFGDRWGPWSLPRPAEPFLLVVHGDCLEYIEKLKREKLIEWDRRVDIDVDDDWCALTFCMITGLYWDQVIPPLEMEDLHRQLTPVIRASLTFDQGLHSPSGPGWLCDSLPLVRIDSFDYCTVRIEITDEGGDYVFSADVDTNESIELRSLTPGRYVVQAKRGARTLDTKSLSVVDWDSLSLGDRLGEVTSELSHARICGAAIYEEPNDG